MIPLKANVLIAEDDPSVLQSLDQVLSTFGYVVRTVTNGLQAVAAIREQVPDVLLSDLNMPGMSGYELLSIVNRRFPGVRAVAMSGAYAGSEIPEGLPADAFYQKGCGIPTLMNAMERAEKAERPGQSPQHTIWMQKIAYETPGENSIMITCPECFRTFPHAVTGSAGTILDAGCVHCGGSIVFAVVPTLDRVFAVPYQPALRYGAN
jgi:CheY-like chemotaxis protein